MEERIPRELLGNKYRKEMLEKGLSVLSKIEKMLPITEAYLLGSFTTAKKRPADVDVILLMKTRASMPNEKWSLDFVMTPANQHGNLVLEDARRWMKQKYGAKKSAVIKLK